MLGISLYILTFIIGLLVLTLTYDFVGSAFLNHTSSPDLFTLRSLVYEWWEPIQNWVWDVTECPIYILSILIEWHILSQNSDWWCEFRRPKVHQAVASRYLVPHVSTKLEIWTFLAVEIQIFHLNLLYFRLFQYLSLLMIFSIKLSIAKKKR